VCTVRQSPGTPRPEQYRCRLGPLDAAFFAEAVVTSATALHQHSKVGGEFLSMRRGATPHP
jgi:hypothetical protein